MTDVVDFNQINTQRKFTGFSEGPNYEQAKAEALADAQAQAVAEIGPNVQYVSFNVEDTRIDDNPAGGFIYRVSITVTTAAAPTSVATPLTTFEQENAAQTTTVPAEATPTSPTRSEASQADTATATNQSTAQTTGTATTSAVVYKQDWVDNPLLEYESYTYSLSLQLLGIQQYNSIVNDDSFGKTYVPQNVLIASAGRYSSVFQRDPAFTEDFYFEDLKIKTIINTTSRNRNSNLVECSFTVIEPLGFTLINRMLDAANRVNQGVGNYLQMPYLLQIDFYASKDGEIGQIDSGVGNNYNNVGALKEHTKVLPIRITNIKSRLTSRGTEYTIDAVPFNHQAFSQLNISLPVSTNVTATKVKDIFGSSAETADDTSFYVDFTGKYNTEREAAALRRYISQATGPNEADAAVERLSTLTARLANQYAKFGITGFCAAVNSYYQVLKAQNQISQVNTIRVIFDSEIGDAVLFPQSGPVNAASTPSSGNTTEAQKAQVQSAAGRPTGQLTFDGSTLNIPAGTTVDRLIDWAVRNSDYIGNQIKDPSLDPKNINTGPLRWFKIIPKIRIREYDSVQNRYALDIIFYVKKYTLSAKHPFAPRGRVPGWVKQYNYLYTGQNRDVIDLQIDFNTLYLVEMQTARNKSRYTQTGVPGEGKIRPDESYPWAADLNDPSQVGPVTQNAFPLSTAPIADTTATMNRMGGNNQVSVDAGDLYRSLMLGAKGDMINVNMRILGDPHFIKQDDIFMGQNLLNPSGQFLRNGNSLYMDGGELYVFINFLSPVDYDESTGIANPKNGKYSYSEFSGVYKVISVDNTFSRGKFEQTLNLAKLLYDQAGQPITSQSNRTETVIDQAITPVATSNTVRFTGPRVNLAALDPTTNAATAAALGAALNPGAVAQQASNLLNKAVTQVATGVASKVAGALVDKGMNVAKDLFKTPTWSSNPNDYTGYGATDTNYGAFGEAPTGVPENPVGTGDGSLYDTATLNDLDWITRDDVAPTDLTDLGFGTGDDYNLTSAFGINT